MAVEKFIAVPSPGGADAAGFPMDEALRLARAAEEGGEVPVGAVVLLDGEIVGRGSNRPIGCSDPTAHAEIVALREAAARVGNYRIPGALVVVTLEPCLMCLGAMVHARVGRLVYGARDPKLGATALLAGAGEIPGGLNHRIDVRGGVREEECAALLREFFAGRRREGFVAESGNAANRACGEVPKWS